jgi:hypothetical protein
MWQWLLGLMPDRPEILNALGGRCFEMLISGGVDNLATKVKRETLLQSAHSHGRYR